MTAIPRFGCLVLKPCAVCWFSFGLNVLSLLCLFCGFLGETWSVKCLDSRVCVS